jgi:ribosomal RNA-processing protein 17
VNALLADAQLPIFADDDDEDGWNGIPDEPVEPVDHEAEYIDEDKYTTVTVEAVDVSKEGLQRTLGEDEEDEETIGNRKKAEAAAALKEEESKKKVWPKKERKKKFRYESKAERKFTRGKQKAGNKAKADARRGTD